MKYLHLTVCFILLLSTACSDDPEPVLEASETGVWTDPDDGETYNWIRIGDQEWMTSNLRAGVPYYEAEYDLDKYGDYLWPEFSESREEEKADLEEYGNLYEWGTACRVCAGLKDGWRMATDEDWKRLEMNLGMSVEDADGTGWRPGNVAALLQAVNPGFNLQMSGCWVVGDSYCMRVRYVGEKGYYWTSSQADDGRVFYRKFLYNSSDSYRNTTDTLSVPAMRVRCVRDAG